MIEGENKDLALHVALCGERHKDIAGRLDALKADMRQVKAVAWAVMAAVLLGGGVTLRELLPIARALAGIAMP